MTIALIVNGISYDYPQNGDEEWGVEATNWAQAVTNNMLQKTGGLFTLSAEVDFGASHGLRSLYYEDRTANPATAGAVRLGNTSCISWRNAANSANIDLCVGADNKLDFGGVELVDVSSTQTLSNKSIVGGSISGVTFTGVTLTNPTLNNVQSISGVDLDDIDDVDTSGVINGEVLTYNSSSGSWEPGAAGAGTFQALTDTPNSYSGEANKVLRVNGAENAVEFATDVTSFLLLTDSPASYSGQGGRSVVVNAGETGLEFAANSSTFLGLTDTPSSYSGQGGRFAKVNIGETAVEFVADPGYMISGSSTLSDLGDVASGGPSTDDVLTWNGAEWVFAQASSLGYLQNVVDDTTPQLGGDLDVNGQAIVSTSNADIDITPDGTGQIVLDGQRWPSTTSPVTGYTLQSDNLGNLSWNSIDLSLNVLDDLGDVDVDSPADLDVLAYDSGLGQWTETTLIPGDLGDVGDVTLTSVATNQVLAYTGSAWENVTLASLGGTLELSDLSDVASSTPTNRNVLVADGVDWESRALAAADIQSGTFANGRISVASVTQHEGSLSISVGQIPDLPNYLLDVVDDTTPSLGGDLNVNSNNIISSSGVDINLLPGGTGNVSVGTLTFDADQTVGAGQDNYVLTYDHSSGTVVLEPTQAAGLAAVVDDTTPQLGGDLDVNGQDLVSTSNGNIRLVPNGTGNVVLGNYEFDADQTVGAGQDNYVMTYDDATGLVSLEASTATPGGADTELQFNDGSTFGASPALVFNKDDDDPVLTVRNNSSSGAAGAKFVLDASELTGTQAATMNFLGPGYDVIGGDLQSGFITYAGGATENDRFFTIAALRTGTVRLLNSSNGVVEVTATNGDVNIQPGASSAANIDNINPRRAFNAQTGTTYTAVLSDAGKMITLDNASAITMTIPANASVAYPVGTELNFIQLGAGQVTIAITSDTLNVDSSLTTSLNGQYAVATALKIASTTWVLFGNLEPV